MTRRWAGALCLVVALSGCKDDARDGAPSEDAGPALPPPVFEDPASGARFSWPPTWRRVAASSAPDEDQVVTLARVERHGLTTLVPPRAVLTLEPTTLTEPELAQRKVKNLLEARLDAQGAQIRRISLLKHSADGRPVGVLDALYAVPVPDRDPASIRHRSVVALVPVGEGSLAILTLTATYLADDHDRVGSEVDALLNSLGFTAPRAEPAVDRGG